MYSPYVADPLFEYNLAFARFINWPPTLGVVGYLANHDPLLEHLLNRMMEAGKVWGGAYVITTHGLPMPKTKYLVQNVLPSLLRTLETVQSATTCAGAARALQGVEGIGSFLAGQIVADMKNTPGHKLFTAQDIFSFCVPGPGSLRGASWFLYGQPTGVGPSGFQSAIREIRSYLGGEFRDIDFQDFQNCLCEFDKYMRVKTGTGRSKRLYAGS